jgi:hypothetical protein
MSVNIYPVLNEYICKLNIQDQKDNKCYDIIKTVIILDISGSMGSNVKRLVNSILPKFLKKMEYTELELKNLIIITFETHSNILYFDSIEKMEKHYINAGSSTCMSGAIKNLGNILKTYDTCTNIRLLTLSDGIVFDQQDTLDLATELATYYKDKHVINSQAIRFYTSAGQPDTRALASVLQFNTYDKATVIDLDSSLKDEEIVDNIAKLFETKESICIKSPENNMKMTPWSKPTNSLMLSSKNDIFWLTKNSNIYINEKKIEIREDKLTLDNFKKIRPKLEYYLNQIKILKIVNTKDSQEEIKNIVKYFSSLEKELDSSPLTSEIDKLLACQSLKGRIQYFKNEIKQKNKSLIMEMSKLANDDKVNKLNATQQAEYLREIDYSKNSKGLAKRSLSKGLDFDTIIREEIKNMSQNLAELKKSDNDDISFYSQDSTVEGIYSVCELLNSKNDDQYGMLDEMTATDILQIFGIVGVACNSIIGSFPDPMTYRILTIYPGCYVSLADVINVYTLGKKMLKVPGFDKEITNVIPIFNDLTVLKFLKKYASKTLEYMCGVGMRRVISDIPMTFAYTVCAGIWKMTEVLDENKSEINISTFTKFLNTYEVAIGDHFDHLLQWIKEQDEEKSYYIKNNGITNMIAPLLKLTRDENKNCKYMDRIMRALFEYEIAQMIKKYKKEKNINVKNILDELVGIDFEKNAIKIPDQFTTGENIVIDKDYQINHKLLQKFMDLSWYIKYSTLFPELFSNRNNPNKIKTIKKLDESYICNILNIKYPLIKFYFYNVVQALLCHTKASRVDYLKNEMKTIDLQDQKRADNMVKKYVNSRYKERYEEDLAKKIKNEKKLLSQELVNKIISSGDKKEIINLFQTGLKRNNVWSKITNPSSDGFVELKNKLLDLSSNVPRRITKIKILLLGKINNETIWNNGNVLATNLVPFRDIFTKLKKDFDIVRKSYEIRGRHIYRDGPPNCHGHSNEKPSYWAFGYQTLKEMITVISNEEWIQYKSVHTNCCGVNQFIIV